MPSRENLPDFDIRVSKRNGTESYMRETITMASEPGDRMPAYLYVPKGMPAGGKRIGIVALHPTHEIGKGVVDGQGGQPNQAYAKVLAERGHVVIAPDYPSFGAN